MTNPYQSPDAQPGDVQQQPGVHERQQALAALQIPATGLLVVSVISVALLVMTLPFDVFLLVSGGFGGLAVDEEKAQQIVIRMIWGLAILAASGYCVFGALQMKNLKSYQHAWGASVVAVIPCLGPCCILGIPFGASALTALSRPEVRSQFES